MNAEHCLCGEPLCAGLMNFVRNDREAVHYDCVSIYQCKCGTKWIRGMNTNCLGARSEQWTIMHERVPADKVIMAEKPRRKPRYDLVPPIGLRAVAQRLADNCAKHGERGGQLGDVSLDTLLEKMLRHADQAMCLPDGDTESKRSHLAAVAFNAMRAIEVI